MAEGWERIVDRYVGVADRLLPGRVIGFYVVGSVALGGYRPARSDVDFVAVLDEQRPGDSGRLRVLHWATAAPSGMRAVARGRLALPGTCNGMFVTADQLERPVSEIQAVASHSGPQFHVGSAFDANPVQWKTFAERGVTVRGRPRPELALQPQPELLREWNLANLDSYWRRVGEGGAAPMPLASRLARLWSAAWCVLGPPRLHCTIATGEVVTKEAAGEYALETFDRRWHPVVREALSYWRGERPPAAFPDTQTRLQEARRFVLEVVRSAHEL